MPTPASRTPVRVARGTYANLAASLADLQEGEICYATDQNKLYAVEGGVLITAGGGSSVTASDTAPSSPNAGDLWYDSTGGRLYVYYNDGTSSQWVDAAPQGGGTALIRGNTSAEVIDTGSDGRFVVATEGTEALRVDASQRLLVGASSSASSGSKLQIQGDTNNLADLVMAASNADGPALYLSKSRGSVGSPAEISSGDTLGSLIFQGYDGATWKNAAYIQAFADGSWTDGGDTTDNPSRLVFSTTADGESTPTERMRIAQNGVITIQNGAAAAIGTLTDGAVITPDFAADCNFTIVIGGNRTMANPINITAGQSGSIFIVQDATGSRLLSWGSYWDFPGGSAPVLSTAANAIDRIDYICRSSTSIHTVFTANYS